jgi:hypothetical protein
MNGSDMTGDRNDRLGADPTGVAARAGRALDGVSNRIRAAGERTAERARDRYATGADPNERIVEGLLDRCEPTPADERPEETLLRALHCVEDGLAGYDPEARDRPLHDALLEAAREEHEVAADRPDRSDRSNRPGRSSSPSTGRPRESALDRYGLDADRLGRGVHETLRAGGAPPGRGHGCGLEPALDAARREIDGGSLPGSAGPLLAFPATVLARQGSGGAEFGSGPDRVFPTALAAIEKALNRYEGVPGGAGGSGGSRGSRSRSGSSGRSPVGSRRARPLDSGRIGP